MKILAIKESSLCEVLDIAPRTVREQFSEFRLDKGKYNFIDSIKKYVSMLKKGDGYFVDKATMAECLGVTERTITTYVRKQILFVNSMGKFDLVANIANYLESNNEHNKYLKIKREREEIKLKVEQELYISAQDLEIVLSNLVTNFKAKLIQSSKKIVTELKYAKEEDYKKIISSNILGTLSELSEYTPGNNLEVSDNEQSRK